jgi:hypothetical protein
MGGMNLSKVHDPEVGGDYPRFTKELHHGCRTRMAT